MSRTKMTPEEKEAARVNREALKQAQRIAQQERVAREEAEWEANKKVLFLEMFVKVAHMNSNLQYRQEKDYNFNQKRDMTASFYTLTNGVNVIEVSAYGYGSNRLIQDSFSRYEYKQFVAEFSMLENALEDYDDEQERKQREAEEREATRMSALSKLTAEEKKVLGLNE